MNVKDERHFKVIKRLRRNSQKKMLANTPAIAVGIIHFLGVDSQDDRVMQILEGKGAPVSIRIT